MTNKTISINPSLFNVGALTKTKKNRDKINKSNNVPLISPNKLKDKILKRIKEHKLKETENFMNEKDKNRSEKNVIESENGVKTHTYTDEFNDSIQYLQSLSEQSKRENQQNDYSQKVERRKQELQRKTLKSYSTPQNIPEVNLELPDELKETINTNTLSYQTETIHVRPPVLQHQDNVPYGILKGGSKPTYRQWTRTHKNSPIKIESQTINQTPNVQNTSVREQKLQMLKKKMIENNLNHNHNHNNTNNINNNALHEKNQANNSNIEFVTPILNSPNSFENSLSDNNHFSQIEKIAPLVASIDTDNIQLDSMNGGSEKNSQSVPYKKIIKRTIRKKYKLGKSKNKRQIGILIKDSQTRKNIVNSQKELKRTPLKDCKKYLQTHNLIKVGGGAPNDVIRATYESAMMAGEITNINKDTLLNNIMKEDNSF